MIVLGAHNHSYETGLFLYHSVVSLNPRSNETVGEKSKTDLDLEISAIYRSTSP